MSRHKVRPVPQLMLMQCPATQSCPLAQTVPQPPQLLGSFCVSLQPAPHGTAGSVHVVPPPVHVPLLHDCPTAHARPHAPQLERSIERLVQTGPHAVVPVGQVLSLHTPPEHD